MPARFRHTWVNQHFERQYWYGFEYVSGLEHLYNNMVFGFRQTQKEKYPRLALVGMLGD